MKNFNKITVWLVTLIAVLTVACAVSLVTLCLGGARPDIYNKKQTTPPMSSAELGATFDYGDGYVKKIIFVGDKTISPIKDTYPDIEKSQVWSGADGSLALDNNLKTIAIIHSDDGKGCSIPSATELYQPQYVLMTVGLENGVAYCSEAKFKGYYSELVNAIKEASPDTKIILQSIFPVSRDTEKENPNISNDRINTANRWIAELCEELSVRYLNTASVLKDKNGYLSAEYDSGDGITLNENGYRTMIEYIRTHGYK